LPSCPSFFKKKIFLLIYDSYTGGFIVVFPYIHVLYPELVRPLHYSPFYPIPFLSLSLSIFCQYWGLNSGPHTC
jgi:hypothetical protein